MSGGETANRIVVFDLDETLGYFTQLHTIFENQSQPDKQTLFNHLLDMFPEYKRPLIETVLAYLKEKKQKNECKRVMIYTNNQRDKPWVYMIKTYFEHKIGFPLFDHIICAFKINGQQIEPERTSHSKSYKDFIKCAKIPENAQICFIDDTYFHEMHNSDVYYIKVKPYVFNLDPETICERLSLSSLYGQLLKTSSLVRQLKSRWNGTKKSEEEYEVDKIITKEMLNHIHLFFKSKEKRNHKKTCKRGSKRNKTSRNKN